MHERSFQRAHDTILKGRSHQARTKLTAEAISPESDPKLEQELLPSIDRNTPRE